MTYGRQCAPLASGTCLTHTGNPYTLSRTPGGTLKRDRTCPMDASVTTSVRYRFDSHSGPPDHYYIPVDP